MQEPLLHRGFFRVGFGYHHANDADIRGQLIVRPVGAKPGVGEANRVSVFDRDDQAVPVKVGLGKGKHFQQCDRHRLHHSALIRLGLPDADQLRRVAIEKRTVLNQRMGRPFHGTR